MGKITDIKLVGQPQKSYILFYSGHLHIICLDTDYHIPINTTIVYWHKR